MNEFIEFIFSKEVAIIAAEIPHGENVNCTVIMVHEKSCRSRQKSKTANRSMDEKAAEQINRLWIPLFLPTVA